jgi:hypothetical protein
MDGEQGSYDDVVKSNTEDDNRRRNDAMCSLGDELRRRVGLKRRMRERKDTLLILRVNRAVEEDVILCCSNCTKNKMPRYFYLPRQTFEI